MYTLTKSHTFEDSIALESGGNKEELKITLDITPDLVRDFRKLQIELIGLEKENKTTPETAEKTGKAVMGVLTLLLGEENTRKIFAFYDNDPAKTLSAVFPYIQESILPKLQETAKNYKRSFKKRRW